MEKMGKGRNIVCILLNWFLKKNIKMEKEMEKRKNTIIDRENLNGKLLKGKRFNKNGDAIFELLWTKWWWKRKRIL